MRQICSITDPFKAKAFGQYLTSQGIKNQVLVQHLQEMDVYASEIWVLEEEDVERAKVLVQALLDNQLQPLSSTGSSSSEKETTKQEARVFDKAPLTLTILIVCLLSFFLQDLTEPHLTFPVSPNLIAIPLTTSPLTKTFLYDWPKPYQWIDEIKKEQGEEVFAGDVPLSATSIQLLEKAANTPIWEGYYPLLVDTLTDQPPTERTSPTFGSIKEGQLWRLITPIFLHYDLFHLLFNMMWLIYLGRMIEKKIGWMKTLLFISLVSLSANTAQYLHSGSNFLGYSAVLTGYLGFIWVRQQVAPWENYPLPGSVFKFMLTFILGAACVGLLFFILDISNPKASLHFPIANTAHLVGLFAGMLLGRLPLFAWKS